MDLHLEEYAGTAFGLGTIAAVNIATRRPVISRLPVFLVGGIAGFIVGNAVYNYTQQRILEREVIIQDYVSRHPSDFPELHPKKYKDVLETWHPIR